jgi:hypothetical protein
MPGIAPSFKLCGNDATAQGNVSCAGGASARQNNPQPNCRFQPSSEAPASTHSINIRLRTLHMNVKLHTFTRLRCEGTPVMDARQPLVAILVLSMVTSLPLFGADDVLVLQDATPVRLRLNRNLSSADAKEGETADFEVLDEVKIGDTLIVVRGATAIATVTQAQKKRRMARGGKLDVNIDFVRAVNGDKIALRAVKETSGGGHTGAMTGAIVATSLIFFPAAPFFLFMHGKDITIPKGTELTAYTNGEIKLEAAKFIKKETQVAAPRAVKGPKLTNADVVTLKQNGFSDEVVIAKIKASAADYKLETQDLLELKKTNISEGVITAMIEASKRQD